MNTPTDPLEEPMAVLDVTYSALQSISTNIMHLPPPKDKKSETAIFNARKYAAVELTKLGYSRRQVMGALGLKSPQSVSYYLDISKREE